MERTQKPTFRLQHTFEANHAPLDSADLDQALNSDELATSDVDRAGNQAHEVEMLFLPKLIRTTDAQKISALRPDSAHAALKRC
jgi:hypothetical protein